MSMAFPITLLAGSPLSVDRKPGEGGARLAAAVHCSIPF